ncbi:P27 family phage terminase small subunit [Woeseia oceani]|uniref:Terminase n=1 Tax=Woeseia oceani TaxID=1548547 RepID=A0A193LEF3_9GAMM|nr:P27 family phage terminase small subunit [Woeseia oceani]ANO50843.1 hypothetical protein BA177_06150 [Woeseia oceani]
MKNSETAKSDTLPATLTDEAASWWAKLVDEYAIDDDAGRLLLQTALEAFDLMRTCQQSVREDGAKVKDRFGQFKAHPLLATERDARSQMLAALKQLNLDIEPLRDSRGRPPGTFRGGA